MIKSLDKPLVSIICDVYNHEPFLRQCLDGFVMQQTDFPIEVLIHDDASTDGSAAIIREYEARYPALFRPIYETENQYKKQHLWADIQFPRITGKYAAICEGDDYWTDPLKLQKQVDYMEAHPDCTLCFHNAVIHWNDGSRPDQLFAPLEDRDYSGLELCEECISPTASYLFRASLVPLYSKMILDHPRIIVGDVPLAIYCASIGTVHCFSETMSVYRKHTGSFMATYDGKNYAMGMYWDEMGSIWGKTYFRYTKKKAVLNYLRGLAYSLKQSDFKTAVLSFVRGVLYHPVTAIPIILKLPQEKKERLKNTDQ